jgi:hypothetical protein
MLIDGPDMLLLSASYNGSHLGVMLALSNAPPSTGVIAYMENILSAEEKTITLNYLDVS